MAETRHVLSRAKGWAAARGSQAARRGFEPAAKLVGIEGVSFHDITTGVRVADDRPGHLLDGAREDHGARVERITEKRYIHLFDKQRTDDAVG